MTREEALAGHRRLWNEIADMIERGKEYCFGSTYKKDALQKIGEEQELHSDCYCCEYAGGYCESCPVVWNSEDESEDVMCDDYNATGIGEYAEFRDFIYERNYPAAAQMARKIANLPERVSE